LSPWRSILLALLLAAVAAHWGCGAEVVVQVIPCTMSGECSEYSTELTCCSAAGNCVAAADPACPKGAPVCDSDAACGAGEECSYFGHCGKACDSYLDCGGSEPECVNRICTNLCASDGECAAGYVCHQTFCTDMPRCGAGGSCPAGATCTVQNFCMKLTPCTFPDATPCAPGAVCMNVGFGFACLFDPRCFPGGAGCPAGQACHPSSGHCEDRLPPSSPTPPAPEVPLGALARGVLWSALGAAVGYEPPPNATLTLSTRVAGESAEWRATFTTAMGTPETQHVILGLPGSFGGTGFVFNGFTALGPAGTEVGSYGLDLDRDGALDVVLPIRAVDWANARVDRGRNGRANPLDPTVFYDGRFHWSLVVNIPRGGDASTANKTASLTTDAVVTLRAGVVQNPATPGPWRVQGGFMAVDADTGDGYDGLGSPPSEFGMERTIEITPVPEFCGNATDEDGDLLPDFRDPDCCRGAVQALAVSKVLLRPAGSGSRLLLVASLPDASGGPPAGDVFVQLQARNGAGFTALVPGDRFKRRGKERSFIDRKGTLAAGLTSVVLASRRRGGAKLTAEAKRIAMPVPDPGDLHVVMGVRPRGQAGAQGACAAGTAALKPGKKRSLRFP
jgi:hypothetical protein